MNKKEEEIEGKREGVSLYLLWISIAFSKKCSKKMKKNSILKGFFRRLVLGIIRSFGV
jgi:hypothetical protein